MIFTVPVDVVEGQLAIFHTDSPSINLSDLSNPIIKTGKRIIGSFSLLCYIAKCARQPNLKAAQGLINIANFGQNRFSCVRQNAIYLQGHLECRQNVTNHDSLHCPGISLNASPFPPTLPDSPEDKSH